MRYENAYADQVRLLVRILPAILEQDMFALKGGTAINLFVRDLPRLSVDIDLTYIPVADRDASLAAIDKGMKAIEKRIAKRLTGKMQITRVTGPGTDMATKLIVRNEGVQVKVEVTPVLRGCVFEPQVLPVSKRVEEEFGFAEARVVSHADLYAGKIVAALDRQHPRDLFDVRDLLRNEGINDELRTAFIVYVLSHNRTIGELLAPTLKDIEQEYERAFAGMTAEEVKVGELTEARAALVKAIVDDMPNAHRSFLLGFKKGDPDWSLLGVPGVENLPAVQWKMQNLDKLGKKKREELVTKLEAILTGRGGQVANGSTMARE